jgi:hypothetical protein
MGDSSDAQLRGLLYEEWEHIESLRASEPDAWQELSTMRANIEKYIRATGKSGSIESIVSAERTLVEHERSYHARNKAASQSLIRSLEGLGVIELNVAKLRNPARYACVNESYLLSNNRKNGLPIDEGRQALASQAARLSNQSATARLSADEGNMIEARTGNLKAASALYTDMQRQALQTDAHQMV